MKLNPPPYPPMTQADWDRYARSVVLQMPGGENLEAAINGKAPKDAAFLVSSGNDALTGERLVATTPTIAWDFATAGQAKANLAYERTAAEIAAGVTPTNYAYSPEILDVRRFMTPAQAAGDGSVNCQSAFQNAANVMPNNQGGIIFVPRGTFRVNGTVTLKPKTIVVGQGWASTINFYAQDVNDNLFENSLATAGPDGWLEFRDLSLNLSNASEFTNATGIDLRDRSGGGSEHASYCKIVNVRFSNWTRAAIYMDKSTVSHIDLCEFNAIQNILHGTAAGTAWPILINGDGNGVEISRIHVLNCDGVLRVVGASTSAALVLRNSTLEGGANYANPSLAEHVFIEGATSFSFVENYVEGLRTGPSGGPGTDAVIRLKNVRQASIARNYMQSDLLGTDVSYRFVRVEGDCRNVVIEQNDMEDPTNAYVLVEGGAEDTIVRNNRYVFGGAAETNMTNVRSRISGTCLLEGNEYSQTINYAASVTPDARAGKYIAVGALTGNLTINAPTNPPAGPGIPREVVFELVQDGTGGRTVTWNAVFRSNYTDTGNTSNKRNVIRFQWDGSAWNGIASGWF